MLSFQRMVYGILILNIGGDFQYGYASGQTASSAILFANFYTPQANNALKEKRQLYVASKVQV